MAKELIKFQADFKKKVAGPLKTANLAEAKKLTKRVSIAHSNAWEGEDYLKESMVPAHKAGIRGTKLTDYMANKDFKDGYTTFKQSVENLAKELNASAKLQKEAKDALAAAKKLEADIAKDLKKRKDKSESKKEIENLHAKVKAAVKDFTDAVAQHDGIPKGKAEYPVNFPKKVAAVLKTAPDEAAAKKDSTELPQMLQDRNLKSNTNKVASYIKDIKSKSKDAIDKVADDDKKAAAVLLKDAAASLKGLKTIHDQYVKIANDKKMKMAIEDSKDKAMIKKTIDAIKKGYTDSERTLRGTMTTIKKAG